MSSRRASSAWSYVSLIDVAVAAVVAIAILMPARPQTAVAAARLDDETRWTLAATEARLHAHPGDGQAAADLSRLFREARLLDWAIEAPALTASAEPTPTTWRAALAASAAYAGRLDVQEAFAWAQTALASCAAAGAACPSWEQVRVELYTRHLEAGIKSGIDPRKDPDAFRRAGEAVLRTIRVREPRRGNGAP
jgi:hypothetical protein